MTKFLLFSFLIFITTPIWAGQYIFTENKGHRPDHVYFESTIQGGKVFYESDKWKIVQGKFIPENEDDSCGVHYCDDGHHHPLPNHFHAIELQFLNTENVQPIASKSSAFYYNYFLGNDPNKWGRRAYSFQELTYADLYPCIDLHAEEENGNLKYDFRLKAGTNPNVIELAIKGAEHLSINSKGALEIQTTVTTIIDKAPYAFQLIEGEEQEVVCHYVLKENKLSFIFPEGYNEDYDLVIDPELIFSSYSGSDSSNYGWTAAHDAEENSIGGGGVSGGGYPVTDGVLDENYNGGSWDMGITKFKADGTDLIYSTYIGGSGTDHPHSMITNSKGQLVIFGSSDSGNFPTENAFDDSFNGSNDAVVVVLSADGSELVGSTFFGGSNNDALLLDTSILNYNYGDEGRGEVFLDSDDNIYIGCVTSSNNIATPGVFQETKASNSDGIIAKFNEDVSNLEWASYFGGSGADAIYSIKVNDSNEVYVAGGTTSSNLPTSAASLVENRPGGTDGFLAHLSPDGSSLFNCTYLGTDEYDQCHFVEIDQLNNVYTFGQTEGKYETSPGAYVDHHEFSPQFIHKLSPDLSTTIFAAKFGTALDGVNLSPTALNVDICNRVYISGWSSFNGYNLPTTPDAIKEICVDGLDFYVMVLEEAGDAIQYATFYGQDAPGAFGDHVDGGTSRFSPNGYIHQAVCSGGASSTSFPTSPDAFETENGSSWNLAVFKIFLDPQILDVTLDFDADQATCSIREVEFLNTTSNYSDEAQFFWDFGDGDTSTVENPTHAFPTVGDFDVQLVIVDSSTCNIADTLIRTVSVIEEGEIPGTTFTATPNGTCGTTVYDFSNNTALLSNTADYDILWDFGDGNTSTSFDTSFDFGDYGDYDVSLSVSSSTLQCVDDSTYTIQVNVPAPFNFESNLTLPDTICANESFQIYTNNTEGTPDTYSWNFGDANTSNSDSLTYSYNSEGNYTISVDLFDAQSCVQNLSLSHDIVIEGVKEDILIDFGYTLPTDCENLEVSFINNTALVEPSSEYIFDWTYGDGISHIGFEPTHVYDEQGTYTVSLIIQNADDCKTITDYSTDIVIEFDDTNAAFSMEEIACTPYQLTVNSEEVADAYEWRLNGEVFTSPVIDVLLDEAGTYDLSLVVSDALSCNKTDTLTRTLELFPLADANFDVSELTAKEGDTILFNINEIQNNVDYSWSIDGIEQSELFSEYIFEAGTYEVCLNARTGNADCNAQSCKTFDIIEEFFAEVPTAFTPNGDNVNDVFKLIWLGVDDIEFSIYNRFGKRVFHTKDKSEGWDGTYKGEQQPLGVYVYYIYGASLKGTPFYADGNITLIR